jgi:hypothetical protein
MVTLVRRQSLDGLPYVGTPGVLSDAQDLSDRRIDPCAIRLVVVKAEGVEQPSEVPLVAGHGSLRVVVMSAVERMPRDWRRAAASVLTRSFDEPWSQIAFGALPSPAGGLDGHRLKWTTATRTASARHEASPPDRTTHHFGGTLDHALATALSTLVSIMYTSKKPQVAHAYAFVDDGFANFDPASYTYTELCCAKPMPWGLE